MFIKKSALMRLSSAILLFSSVCGASGLRAETSHHHVHAAHADADRTQEIKRSRVQVELPALQLVREDNARQDIREAIGSGGPVFVNFIFTSCTTVCPVMSETFARLGEETAKGTKPPRLISISIDPEVDTPARLTAYAQQFGAPSAWHFYTGTLAESRTVQKAFGLDIADKMSHPVAAFYYPGHGAEWVRVDGFASPQELAALVAPPAHQHHRHHH